MFLQLSGHLEKIYPGKRDFAYSEAYFSPDILSGVNTRGSMARGIVVAHATTPHV